MRKSEIFIVEDSITRQDTFNVLQCVVEQNKINDSFQAACQYPHKNALKLKMKL